MSDIDTRLPIKLDSTSNGEFAPIPLEPVHHQANQLALENATAAAKRLKLTRRQFLVSAAGAASTLLTMNFAYAAIGRTGGFFELPAEAGHEDDAARKFIGKKEFIFDVQGHYVNPDGAWLKNVPEDAKPLRGIPAADCPVGEEAMAAGDPRGYLDCLGPDRFVKDVFMDSDTDVMVLSFVPSRREAEPLTIEEASATRDIIARMEGRHRLLLHGRVNPNQEGDLDDMDELVERWDVSAFKTYTQWGPDGKGFFLDDPVGITFLEKARKLGVKNICIHKGLPFGRKSYEHSLCDDIGRVAKRFPDLNFLIYHSGFVAGQPERAFKPERNEGIDSLVKSVIDNDVPPNSNVYAELGSTWRYLMRDPDSAAHALGKLFKYIGKDNVLWGTDSIWYGSPQDQIVAFRSFQIAEALQEKHGYPAMTPELRAKVFGLNALKPYGLTLENARKHAGIDRLAREKLAYAENPDPHFRTYGPKTRREFLALLANGD
jgi:hypothetical protein